MKHYTLFKHKAINILEVSRINIEMKFLSKLARSRRYYEWRALLSQRLLIN